MRIKLKMKKGLIGLISLIAVFMLQMSLCVSAEDNTRVKDFLEALDIMTHNQAGDFEDNEAVTRAQLAKILAVINNDTTKGMQYNKIFEDVSEDAWYYDYVAIVYNYGYLSGYDDGLFRPEKKVTANEAASALLRVAGYYNYSKVKFASSDSPFFKAAKEIGILKGVYLEKDDIINRKELAQMVYNTLLIPSMEFVSVSGGSEDWRINKEKNVLEYRMNIIKVKDRLNAVGAMTVLDTNDVLPSDRVIVGDNECKNESKTLLTDYLGYEGVFYVKEYDDDEYSLVYADFTQNESEVEIVNAKDIIKADLKEIRYEDEQTGATRVIRLSDDITVVYNGRVLSSYDGSEFNPDYGKVKLIDDTYLMIYDIKTYVVDRFDMTNNIIYDKYDNGGLILSEDDGYSYFWASGRTTGNPLYNASYDNVLDVLRSRNGEVMTVIISDETVKGVVSSFEEDSIIIDGNSYVCAESFLNIYTDSKKEEKLYEKIEVGMTVEFYLNSAGEIAGCDIDYNVDYSYGYFVKVLRDEIEEIVTLKIYTEEGLIARYETKDKIKFNDEYKVSAFEDVYYSLKDNPQLIKYKLNKDNKIIDVKTAVDNTNGDERFIEDEFSIDYRSGGFTTRIFGKGIGANYSINSSTKVFFIPDNLDKEKQFKLGNDSLLNGDIKDLNLDLFDTDEAGMAKVVVRYTGEKTGIMTTEMLRADAVVITSVQKAYIEEIGDVGIIVNGIRGGAEVSFICEDLDASNFSSQNPWDKRYGGIYTNKKVTELTVGDMILVSTDAQGMLNGFVLLLSPNNLPAKYTEVMSDGGTPKYNVHLAVTTTHYGTVKKRYNTAILVNAYEDGTDKLWNKTFATSGAKVYLYDSKLDVNKVSIISPDEIKMGDEVIIRKDYNTTKEVYVLR